MTTRTEPVSDHARRTARRVAELICRADALLVTAGAGMSVESGLPDFRDLRWFWDSYPPFESLGATFEQFAQPASFDDTPEMAWAWYGHRQQMYREAIPHEGYRILSSWCVAMLHGSFVMTSNIDGQFPAAGFTDWQLVERHGSIHRYQCTVPCSEQTWDAGPTGLEVDASTLRVTGELPRCPNCGALARPNVLMFNDTRWVDARRREQQRGYDEWLASIRGRRLVVVECGAGPGAASIRRVSERLLERSSVSLVRINPAAVEADEPTHVLKLPARQAIALIHESLPSMFGGPDAPAARRRPPEIELPTAPIRLRLEPVTCVDLGRGLIADFDPKGISHDDATAFMERYAAAQSRWVQVPDMRGLSAPGCTMRAAVFRTPEYDAGGTPGIAIVFVQGPGGESVATFGIARRASDGPFLWQLLYETASLTVAPLDYPRVPWVARRPDGELARDAALTPYIAEFERVLTWSYLQFLAFVDATRKKDGAGDPG
jgi:NAD-dependent SIR2 family protein deacetylase